MNVKRINEIKILIIIFLLLDLKDINDKYNNYIFNKCVDKESLKLISLNLTKNQSKIKGLNYLNNIKNNRINNISKKINKPKISVIIPIYNCQDTIDLTLKSIHFQNFNEIEIILINDHSSDNSSHIIEELKIMDQRINIINNFKNMGTFYSRCIGALNSKGEYIIGLDNDDLFLSEDIFETVYLNAKINFFDIVEVKSFNIPNYNPRFEEIRSGYYLSHKDNLILHQPELGISSVSLTNKVYSKDHFAWGKLIRSVIYKKSINKLGKERYSKYNCWTEDVTIVFVLFNTANSFIFLNIYGIFHIIKNTTATYKLSNKHKFITHIFYLGILFDFSRNDFLIKNFVAKYTLRFSFYQIKKLDENNKLFFKSIIKKIIDCKFISKKYKQKIIQRFSPIFI